MKEASIRIDEWNESSLKDLLKILQSSSGLKLTLSYDNAQTKTKNMDAKVTQLLIQIGIPSNLRGYRYIKTALEYCMEDRSELDCVTKRLYPKIAQHYATTPNKVEHAIRHAIENAWKIDNGQMQETLFGYSVGNKLKPTNSAFIATITDYLMLREEQKMYS